MAYKQDPEKKRIYKASYRAKHKAEITTKDIAYRAEHKVEIAARVVIPNAIYRATHKAQIAAYNIAYNAAHKDEKVAKAAAYRATHKTELATYNADNKEKIALRVAYHYAAHKAEKVALQSVYRKTHPEIISASNSRRRAIKMNADINDFTSSQWKIMQAAYDHRCVYCDKRRKGRLTQDHITPLSKGGNHTIANIVPSCKGCNSRKATNQAPIPIQPMML